MLLKQMANILKSSCKKTYDFCKYCLYIIFLRDIHERYLSYKDADDEQSKFANNLRNIDKGLKSVEKIVFLNNIGLYLTAREKVLNKFKKRLLLQKHQNEN